MILFWNVTSSKPRTTRDTWGSLRWGISCPLLSPTPYSRPILRFDSIAPFRHRNTATTQHHQHTTHNTPHTRAHTQHTLPKLAHRIRTHSQLVPPNPKSPKPGFPNPEPKPHHTPHTPTTPENPQIHTLPTHTARAAPLK